MMSRTCAHDHHLLDRLAVRRVRVGDQVLPTWGLAAAMGFHAGVLLALALAVALGLPVLGLPLVAGSTLLTWLLLGLLRRRWTGHEGFVLLEGWIACGLATAAAVYLTGGAVRSWMDAWSAGAALACAIGRVGCAMNGCCHGLEADLGIRHGVDAPGGAVRRLPVQLVEAVSWAFLALSASLLTLMRPGGVAAAFVLVAAGGTRVVLEGWRGDARPHLMGVSESRWLGLGMLGVGGWLLPERPTLVAAAVGGALVLSLWATRQWWLTSSRPLADDTLVGLEALGLRLVQSGPGPKLEHERHLELVVRTAWLRREDGLAVAVSLTDVDGRLDADGARVALYRLAVGLGGAEVEPIPISGGWYGEIPVSGLSWESTSVTSAEGPPAPLLPGYLRPVDPREPA